MLLFIILLYDFKGHFSVYFLYARERWPGGGGRLKNVKNASRREIFNYIIPPEKVLNKFLWRGFSGWPLKVCYDNNCVYFLQLWDKNIEN